MNADAVIVDRFDFAAANLQALRELRDSWISFASSTSAFYHASKRAAESEAEAQTVAKPPAKRVAAMAQDTRFNCTKDWDAARGPSGYDVQFLSITKGEVLVGVHEDNPNLQWTLVRRLNGSDEQGYVPSLRLVECKAKPVALAPPNLSDDEEPKEPEEPVEEPEPLSLTALQFAVTAALEDGESFELGDIKEDFSDRSDEELTAALQNHFRPSTRHK